MYLFEFDENEKLIRIIAAADQLKIALDQGQIQSNWDVETLLSYFRDFDIILSNTDLYNMITKKPLKNIISNIEGDEVVFKGLEPIQDTEAPPPEQSKEVVAKMAKGAMNK
jgi:hypothetical protein